MLKFFQKLEYLYHNYLKGELRDLTSSAVVVGILNLISIHLMIKINYYHSESTFSLDCFFFFLEFLLLQVRKS